MEPETATDNEKSLAEQIKMINGFATQRMIDKGVLSISDRWRIENDRLRQISEACRKNPCETATLILDCMPYESWPVDREAKADISYSETRPEMTRQTFPGLRAEYYQQTRRLDQLRREERAAYSEALRVKHELFEALGRELSALLRGEDGTALQDRTGTIPVPVELVSESLRFLKDYRDGKPAPRDPNELPF